MGRQEHHVSLSAVSVAVLPLYLNLLWSETGGGRGEGDN